VPGLQVPQASPAQQLGSPYADLLMQGGGTMAAGNIRDLWMPLLCLILLFASVIYGASACCGE
jgi:hypothetical protein